MNSHHHHHQQPLYSQRHIPQQYFKLSIALRVLCLCPALWGICIHLVQAKNIAHRDPRAILTMTSTVLDNYIGILWCLLGGLWSFWLTNGLIRRWFIHYEPRPAMIRLFTLGIIFWFFVMYFVSLFGEDQPIWPWVAICTILAISQVIQTIHFRIRGIYKLDVNLKSRGHPITHIIKTVVIPGGAVLCLTTLMLICQRASRPSAEEMVARSSVAQLTGLSAGKAVVMGPAKVQVLIVVISSWTAGGYMKRQEFRDSTLKLLQQQPHSSPQLMPPTSDFTYTYKFILGQAPDGRAKETMAAKIQEESRRYGDMLLLPVSDTYEDLSLKVFKALEWGNQYKFDYLAKTDDDIFVRWDTVAKELVERGPSQYYWQGMGYWNIVPITNSANKNQDSKYNLGVFPPFVAGSLYIFSRDVVTLLTYPGPRFFTKNEDQNIGIWLHPYNIKPIHDRRIQQWDVCEDDMIAKHFSDQFKPAESMVDMYENVRASRPLCTGFRHAHCAACYSCVGRPNHWKDWGYDCDTTKGLTLKVQNQEFKADSERLEIRDKMPKLGPKDQWIIPGLLTDVSSIFSDTAEWARLHWAIWTTDVKTTWQERHYQAIEMLFVHNPDAVLIILSNTIPQDFFVDYTRQGYRIHIMSFSKELLLQRQWYFGPDTKDWLQRWNDWASTGPFFPVHLADYLRLVALYKYGGMYMDMDALWVRSPSDSVTEFIGADLSDNPDDLSWTLDSQGHYLANGVMRFKRGRTMFRHIAELVFTGANYNPECFNCGGPRAFTDYVKKNRDFLERNGLTILKREALYPFNWQEVLGAIVPTLHPDQEIRRIEQQGIGLHLYGKVTNKKKIEEGSVVAAAISIWGLDLAGNHRDYHRGGGEDEGPRLQGPKELVYVTSQEAGSFVASSSSSSSGTEFEQEEPVLKKMPGSFTGIDLVFVRGSNPSTEMKVVKKASVLVKARYGQVSFGGGPHGLSASPSGGSRQLDLDLGDAVSMADLNLMLSKLVYIPPKSTSLQLQLSTMVTQDEVQIEVEFGTMSEGLKVPVVVRSSLQHF